MRNQRYESPGRHVAPRQVRRQPQQQPRRQPRRLLVIAVGVLVPLIVAVGGRFAFAAQNDAAAEPNPNCTLIVPPDPLSVAGLATPYRLRATNPGQGACHEANAAQAAFVQGTVLDPATGKVSVYNPLVIDDGQQSTVPPVKPQLPAGAVVGLWFGFNGTNLSLRDDRGSLAAGKCVGGLGRSVFGQFAHCNAPAFFSAANAAISAGKLAVPPLGTAMDGQACPTTRDFSAVDQDQSDNVTSAYLIVGNSAAQNTAANRAKLGRRGKVQVNGSDNLLVDEFIDKALGCTPFKAPDLADNGTLTTALALNELQAAAGQQAPVALVPPNDPMTKVGNTINLDKLNLYRAGVDQPPLGNLGDRGAAYCKNMLDVQQNRLQADRVLFSRVMSPDKAAANNLFSFLANRLSGSFTNLDCGRLLGVKNPVTLRQQNGVVVDATFFGRGVPAPPSPTSANKRPANNGNGATAVRPTGPQSALPGRTGAPATPSNPAAPSNPAGPSVPAAPSATAGVTGSGAPAGQASAPASTTAAPDPRVDPDKVGDGSSPPKAGKF